MVHGPVASGTPLPCGESSRPKAYDFTQEHVLLRAQSGQPTYDGDPLTDFGTLARRGHTRGGGCCDGES